MEVRFGVGVCLGFLFLFSRGGVLFSISVFSFSFYLCVRACKYKCMHLSVRASYNALDSDYVCVSLFVDRCLIKW